MVRSESFVLGAVTGIGKGLIGAVTKPIGGVVDLLSKTSEVILFCYILSQILILIILKSGNYDQFRLDGNPSKEKRAKDVKLSSRKFKLKIQVPNYPFFFKYFIFNSSWKVFLFFFFSFFFFFFSSCKLTNKFL